MRTTLDASERELSALRYSLASRVARAIDRAGTVYRFEQIEEFGSSVTYALTCGNDAYNELALDDRGQELVVTPVATGRGWRALMGVSTSWRRPNGKRRDFDSAQIICFLDSVGPRTSGAAEPVQLMRLEWEALDRNQNLSGAIAHPHWQVDIGRYALRRPVQPPSLEVSTAIPAAEGEDGLPWLSRLHLAACARWMERPWDEDEQPAPHVSGPQSIRQLEDWIYSGCRYVHHQLNGAIAD